jgi:hypothetical protein
MIDKLNRRSFLGRSALAAVGVGSSVHAAESRGQPAQGQVAPASKGTLPLGKLGKLSLSRIISGGNIISGWCHQRDLLFVANLAKAYLTEQKQFDTLQQLEESGVNALVIDMVQQDLVNKYIKQRGGKIQALVSVRQDWSDWGRPSFEALQFEITQAIDKGASTLFLHGGYCDRLVESNHPQGMDIIGKGLQFIREKGLIAGLGSHALEVPMACDKHGIEPDYYFKTFHHDKYWSATPKEYRKRFCVDGPRSQNHNDFHDNIFCIDPEATIEYMAEKKQPWIAFKVLAAGAINPRSGFKYAFENGADFLAVGMFDFEVDEDIKIAKDVLKEVEQRDRPWRG